MLLENISEKEINSSNFDDNLSQHKKNFLQLFAKAGRKKIKAFSVHYWLQLIIFVQSFGSNRRT